MRKTVLQLGLFIFLITILVLVVYFVFSHVYSSGKNVLEVTFLDVGQGDATLIESPLGTQVLVDGGRDRVVLRELTSVLGFFDRSIDVIVATHPDLDHIGGLVDVLDRYEVRTVIMTENKSDTPAYEAFLDRIKAENATVIFAKRGQVFDLGLGSAGSTTLTVLFPDRNVETLESNTSSIVVQLQYGETEFLLTGDSPIAIEEYLVSLGSELLQSDVLKAGHHGSRTSSSEGFVEAVMPKYAVFSVGKDNTYGHPHKEVVGRFAAHDTITKNTADLGSIFMTSDGISVSVK